MTVPICNVTTRYQSMMHAIFLRPPSLLVVSMWELVLTPFAVLAGVLGAWRLGADPGWTGDFFSLTDYSRITSCGLRLRSVLKPLPSFSIDGWRMRTYLRAIGISAECRARRHSISVRLRIVVGSCHKTRLTSLF